jgi:hypothetical protein
MDAGGVVVSLALVAFGVGMAARSYVFARFSERVDAIGSTTPWGPVRRHGAYTA